MPWSKRRRERTAPTAPTGALPGGQAGPVDDGHLVAEELEGWFRSGAVAPPA